MTPSDLTISELDALEEVLRHDLKHYGHFAFVPSERWAKVLPIIALARRSLAPWQPIETAPKDGTLLLLWERDGSKYNAAFGDVFCGRWDDALLIDRVGHWIDGRFTRNPTHWLPLPPPPSMAAETEETELGRIVPYSTQRYRATPVATQSEERKEDDYERKSQSSY